MIIFFIIGVLLGFALLRNATDELKAKEPCKIHKWEAKTDNGIMYRQCKECGFVAGSSL